MKALKIAVEVCGFLSYSIGFPFAAVGSVVLAPLAGLYVGFKAAVRSISIGQGEK